MARRKRVLAMTKYGEGLLRSIQIELWTLEELKTELTNYARYYSYGCDSTIRSYVNETLQRLQRTMDEATRKRMSVSEREPGQTTLM